MKNVGLVEKHIAGMIEYSWTAHCLFLMACSIPLITVLADGSPSGYPPTFNGKTAHAFVWLVPLALTALLLFSRSKMRGGLRTLDHAILIGVVCLGIFVSVWHYSNWFLALVPVILVGLNYGKRVAVALAVGLCLVVTVKAYLLGGLISPDEYLVFVIILVSTAYLVGGVFDKCRELIKTLDRERVTFKNLVDAFPLGVSVIDGQGNIKYKNPNIGKVESRVCRTIISRGNMPDAGSCLEFELEGQDFRIYSAGFPTAHGEGKTALILENLSETHRLQNEIRKSSYMASVGEMAAGVAHEIRNPLAVIRGYVQLLSEKTDDTNLKDVKPYLHLVLGEIDRLGEIMREFLDLARPQAEKKALVCPEQIISEIQEFMQTEALRRDITLNVDVDPTIPKLHADPAALKQIIFNLIHNAFDAAGRKGQVRLKTYHEPKWAYLEVIDNGSGIPQELQENIFQPFFSGKELGTGLGLAISRRIALDHDGILRVFSKPGYTKFVLQIPLTGNEAPQRKGPTPSDQPEGPSPVG